MTTPDLITDASATFVGTLAFPAEVRDLQIGDHPAFVPVLCLDLVDVGPAHQRVFAQRVYTEATRAAAVAQAVRLVAGMQVRVTSTLHHMRIELPHVDSVTPITPQAAR